MSKKHKVKTKIIYRKIKPVEPSINTSKIKEELNELEAKRLKIREESKADTEGKKGFAKFAAGLSSFGKRANINKQINERRKMLRAVAGTEEARGQVQFLKQRTELEKAKTELREAQKKNQVNFGSGNISYESLFK